VEPVGPLPPVVEQARDALQVYVDLLASIGVDRGLLGPREVDRIWDRHIVNCAVVEEVIPHGVSVADVGSGAGLPGLVLALVRPDLQITLIEPLLRRWTFLNEVSVAMGVDDRVMVMRSRAEDAVPDVLADVVTARAVAPLERLLPWMVPLVRVGGQIVAMKGSSAAQEIEAAAGVTKTLPISAPEVVLVGSSVGHETAVVRCTRQADRAVDKGRRATRRGESTRVKASGGRS